METPSRSIPEYIAIDIDIAVGLGDNIDGLGTK